MNKSINYDLTIIVPIYNETGNMERLEKELNDFISIAGSILIITYALIRRVPVLILEQSMGLLVYGLNIYLSYRENKY